MSKTFNCYHYLQVTNSHSNPDISHRESQHGLSGTTEDDVFGEHSIGVAPDVIGESCQDCHSKAKNAKNECLVCNIEVGWIILLHVSMENVLSTVFCLCNLIGI